MVGKKHKSFFYQSGRSLGRFFLKHHHHLSIFFSIKLNSPSHPFRREIGSLVLCTWALLKLKVRDKTPPQFLTEFFRAIFSAFQNKHMTWHDVKAKDDDQQVKLAALWILISTYVTRQNCCNFWEIGNSRNTLEYK